MKLQWIMITCSLLMIPVFTIAQRQGSGQLRPESRERIEAHRIAFITQKLSLTPDEAAKFWPVYNENKEAVKDLRDDIERPDLMNISNDEATVIIERHLQIEQKRLEMKRSYLNRLKSVIGARKVLMLHAAEKEFNRELLKRARAYGKE